MMPQVSRFGNQVGQLVYVNEKTGISYVMVRKNEHTWKLESWETATLEHGFEIPSWTLGDVFNPAKQHHPPIVNS